MLRRNWAGLVAGIAISSVAFATAAGATTLDLSTLTSEPSQSYMGTPLADLLDATVSFDIVDNTDANCNFTDCLRLSVTNDTDQNPEDFLADIFEIGWSASTNVTTVNPDVIPAGWSFNTSTGPGGSTHLDGFGIHDYSLTTMNPGANPILPAQTYIFSFEVNAGLDMSDFVQFSDQTPSCDPNIPGTCNILTTAVVKFQGFRDSSGATLDLCEDGDPGTPVCDSGFGAVPEPGTAVLVGAGLIGLAYAGRRRS